MFWIKLLFVACIAVSGLLAAARLSRPGIRIALAPGVLAAPALAAAFWAMKGLAPTRLALSGAAEGMFAGGIGAALGPILLRW